MENTGRTNSFPRQNLRTQERRTPSPNCRPTPRLPHRRTPGTMEDTRTRLPILLVATNVAIHRSVLQHLRSLSPDQSTKTSALRRTPTPRDPERTVENSFGRLHSRTSGGSRVRCGHGIGRLGRKKRSLHPHSHNSHSPRSSGTLPPKRMETSRSSQQYCFRPRSTIHCGVHPRTTPTSEY